ncbi:MAG: LPS assembly protein LptD [Steroidobacteraceae bacterium]
MLVIGAGACLFARASDAQVLTCPAYVSAAANSAVPAMSRKPGSLKDSAKLPVNLQFDSVEAAINGDIKLMGNAQVQQGERRMNADELIYNPGRNDAVAKGPVQYEDADLQVNGTDASMNADGGASVAQASFILKTTAGRGTAQNIQVSPEGNVSLDSARYTTCPPGSTDWELQLSDLNINQETNTGTGRNVRLEFKGIPIFYTPWISFPVGNQRKSGFLFPSLGGSSRGGNALATPWYWNLAPNYDDTITPAYDTSRGFKLDNEFRYLGEATKASVVTGYLPHDNKTRDWRGLVQLLYRHDFNDVLRLNVDAADVRDNEWFEDFGQTRDVTSLVYLARTVTVGAYSDNWLGKLNVQNLQVIDSTIPLTDRPYTMLPQLTVQGRQPLPFGAEFNLDSELTYFTRGEVDTATQIKSITGARLNLVPELSLPLRAAGMYVTPSAAWHYTSYQLQNTAAGADRTPSLSAPAYAVDTGMVFERLSSNQRRLYTLEPRMLYSYIPYREQSDLPLFDTGMPDFSLVQLFQTNRFSGPDRLGDANQLSAGVTTRMLDPNTGSQFLSGTLGQAFYFKSPCVTSLVQTACNAATISDRSSDIIGQLSLAAYKNWSVNLGMQWNPAGGGSERGDVSLQYRPAGNRTINLGYNYDRGTVEQWVSSFAWPIGSTWSAYGRVVYSRLDQKFLDHFAGLEYRSCCWNVRAVVGRAVTTRSGEYDTQYKVQLELKGLSSVGTADAFLESSIPGYSARSAN